MSLCPEPAEVLDVGTAHGTTRVYRFGEGDAPPLVLLPGLGATSACYADLLPALAATGPVYTVDTLGEPGRSVQRARLTTHADRARCLDDVLGELGLGEVHLVGGSTGGWHCVNQAVHAPERVGSISLLDPTSVTAPFGRAVVALGLLCAVVRTERALRWFVGRVAGRDALESAVVRLVLAGIREYRPRVPFPARPSEDRLRALRLPVLAVFAGRSAVHDAGLAARRLRALVPHSDVELRPDLAHALPLGPGERDRFTARVVAFAGRATVDGPGPMKSG
ncbi:alpha/beta fold hydrolase [Amycolatopsis nalaikhensis]|uniref:Alpha/beta hydrolase n=1 Tax=Amycolatopsis nalaikhensis TaxID=715472 RepID=A0ABY8XHY3_9PSEU|nr:alpha/beta hydrolase [Amycolatopsis sp. 2-2]WIV55222.1 alpha/beta hydrolase [Amycolatopsis sp. 2-2]